MTLTASVIIVWLLIGLVIGGHLGNGPAPAVGFEEHRLDASGRHVISPSALAVIHEDQT